MARRRSDDEGYGEQVSLNEGVFGDGIEKDPLFNGDDGEGDGIPLKLPGPSPDDGHVIGNTEMESGPLGSRERGRDLRPTSQTPTTFGPRGLPQGVTVDDGMDAGNTFDAPGQSMTPSPSSGNLSFAPTAGNPMQPQRRSTQPSVLYSQSNSPTLSGRAGGLMEGGLGASDTTDRTGPLSPSDLFQRLLQMYGRA